jgi:hypothetical protein
MLFRKISLVAAIATCLFIPATAFAKGGGHGGGHGGHGGWKGGGWHGGGWHRGHGRFWHGRWWGYGVGSCWRWTPAGYIWVCGY